MVLVLVLVLTACGEGGNVLEPGACSSFSTFVDGAGYTWEYSDDYRADGLVVRERIFGWPADDPDAWLSFTTDYTYDAADQLVSDRTTAWEADVQTRDDERRWVWREDGLLLREEFLTGDQLTTAVDYTYDAHDQLVAALAVGEGVPDQAVTYTWEDGREVRSETRLPTEGDALVAWTERTYLAPAPSRDVDVVSWTAIYGGSEGRSWFRYDGELLIEEGVSSQARGDTVTRYTYDAQDRLVSRSRAQGDGLDEMLVLYAYDADGHLVQVRSGLDGDGDGRIDGEVQEQTWTWTCGASPG